MATQTTIQRLARNVRVVDVGEFSIDDKPVLPVTTNGDRQVLFTAPCAMRLYGAHLRAPATLGAGVQIKLQRNRLGANATYDDLTANTAAAADSRVSGNGLVPLDLAAGDTVEVLVSGGNSAAGQIEYDLLVRRA